jgi:5-amino-6-(5-phospho-D-ribitylamino)uracil phosphatase
MTASRSSGIRLVLADLDGTLLDEGLPISATDISALSRLTEHGVVFGIATGRALASVRGAAEAIPGLDYIIASNGGAVFDARSRELVHTAPGFSRPALAALSALARDHGLLLNLYTPTDWHAPAASPAVLREAERSGISPVIGMAWTEVPGPVVMAMLSGEPRQLAAARRQLAGQVPDAIPLDSHYDTQLDISPAGISKGIACQALMGRLGVRRHEVMAIGNGQNDVPMFEACGIGVALRDASQELIKVASYLTVSLAEGAVSAAVDGVVFGDPLAQLRLWRPLAGPVLTPPAGPAAVATARVGTAGHR